MTWIRVGGWKKKKHLFFCDIHRIQMQNHSVICIRVNQQLFISELWVKIWLYPYLREAKVSLFTGHWGWQILPIKAFPSSPSFVCIWPNLNFCIPPKVSWFDNKRISFTITHTTCVQVVIFQSQKAALWVSTYSTKFLPTFCIAMQLLWLTKDFDVELSYPEIDSVPDSLCQCWIDSFIKLK